MIYTISLASQDAIYRIETESALVHTYHFHASFQTSASDFTINNPQQLVVSMAKANKKNCVMCSNLLNRYPVSL
jgi:hypothetical protein